jgi:hypothetical protein
MKGEYTAGTPIFIQVALVQDMDKDNEDGDDQTVIASF